MFFGARRKKTFLVMTAALAIGLVGTLVSVGQQQAYGKETGFTWFGKRDAKVQVFFVSDWFCSYCRRAEPAIEGVAPAVGKVAKYTFLDMPVHRESLEYIPLHLSILEGDKRKYFEGRKALMELAVTTKNPEVHEVRKVMAKRGINFQMADFASVAQASNEAITLLRKHGVRMTPSVLIVNEETKEKRVLSGLSEIQESHIVAAIRSLERK